MKRTNLLSFLPFLVLLLLPHLGSKPILASEDVHSLLLYHNKYFISHSKHFSINHAFPCLICMWFQVSSYVVYFGSHSHVGVITQDAMDRVRETHYDFLGSFTGRSFEQPTILLLFNIYRPFNWRESWFLWKAAVRLPQVPFSTHTQSTSTALPLISTTT